MSNSRDDPRQISLSINGEDDPATQNLGGGEDFANYVSFKDREPDLSGESSFDTTMATPVSQSSGFGILDVDPDHIFVAPLFTEPETLEAMRRLRCAPEELVIVTDLDIAVESESLHYKVLIELDRRRMQLISDIITERNRIISGGIKPPKRHKKKKFKKRKRRRQPPAKPARKIVQIDVPKPRPKPRIVTPPKILTSAQRRRQKVQEQLTETRAQFKMDIECRHKRAKERARAAEERKLEELERMAQAQLEKREIVSERRAKMEEDRKERLQNTMTKLDDAENRRQKMKEDRLAALKAKAELREKRAQETEAQRRKIEDLKLERVLFSLSRVGRQSRGSAEEGIAQLETGEGSSVVVSQTLTGHGSSGSTVSQTPADNQSPVSTVPQTPADQKSPASPAHQADDHDPAS
jgi:hypothetical protein